MTQFRIVSTCVLSSVVACCLLAQAGEFEVKLTVQESAGLARSGEPVSGGIPLPRGLVKDPAALKLLDAEGKEVPAQFSTINRWGSDQSVMWLLVQSTATVPAKGQVTFVLKPGPAAARRDGLKVVDGADAVTVETGRIKFTVSKKRFNLIDQAWLTADGQEIQVIASGTAGGSAITLASGEVYTSTAEPPTEVVVEESGPERATIAVRGLHKPRDGKGTVPYLYGYLVRIRAYAGQPYLRISYALTSGHEPAIGSPLCKGAAISVPLKMAGKVTAAIGGKESVSGELAADKAAVLVCRAPQAKGKNAPPPDPNYRELELSGLGDGAADKLGELGWASAGDGRAVVNLAVRYLRQNYPVALAVEPQKDATVLQLQPWPAEDFLDICSYKTYELQLTLEPAGRATKGEQLLATLNDALRFWAPPEWVNSTDAWGDFGRVAVPDEATATAFRKRFGPYGLAGWRDLGSEPEFESGSSRAPGGGYEPLLKTAPIYLGYLQYNDRRCFDQLERTSWHWRDRRYIYLDGDWSDKSWAGHGGVYWAYYSKGGKDFKAVQPPVYGRYDDAWNYGGRYGPMDTQHFSVDEVVNYYYLTGDRQCLEALDSYGKEAACFVGAFARAGKAKVGREHGWVTRALISVYEATGDKRWFELARAAVKAIMDNQDKTAGCISDVNEKDKDGKPVQHTPFMNAAVGMALGRYYRHHPEEEVRDSILGIADWLCYDVAVGNPPGFSYHWATDKAEGRSASGHRCMSTMSWAYLATGQQRYLDAADKHAGKLADWYQNGFGQEYVYFKTTKRPDPTAPAPVKDLAAEALGGGKVKLTWTAPGGDGDKGQAAEYQVKWATKEIRERSDWRTKAEAEISFWAATNCKGEPKPAAAGAKETYVAEGVPAGTCWFALKTYDAQPNQSDLSNVVKVEVR
jgi:hypothetical protein